MRGFECSTDIAAPREHVFQVFTAFDEYPDRLRGIESLEVEGEGPVGSGTRLRETRVLYGRKATETLEITAFEPPEHYRLETRSHGAHFMSEFRFEPRGEAGTRVRVRFEARPLSLFARLMSFLSAMMMKSVKLAIEEDLDDLRQHAEGAS